MTARLVAVAAAALLLVACGGDDGGRFDAQVDDVRQAVQAGDREAALTSLEALQADALAAHAEGGVADEVLFELNALVDQARTQLDQQLPEPTTTTEATTTTTPPAPALDIDDDRDDDEKKGKKGEGKGRDGDDGGDDD